MSASPKPRSVFSAVCRSNGIVLGRTRATVGSRFSLNASLASAYSNPAAFILPGGGPLRRRGEPTRTRMGPHRRSFSRGPREISNFCRRFGSGKPSFLRIPFVDHCSEATNSITHAFGFSPVVVGQIHLSQSAGSAGLVARVYGQHTSERKIPNVQFSSGVFPHERG
jgi:hypothetical protein